MTSIDYTEPHQVFNRLAQIQHDTKKRIATIGALTVAQTQPDREPDQLELAYQAPKDYTRSSRRLPTTSSITSGARATTA